MSGQDTISSFPLPPVQYITQYSNESIKRGRAPKPPPPIPDTYTMFGRQFNVEDPIIRPLESQGIKRLYPQNYDRRRELKKLNHSLLVNFLELVDTLIECPDTSKRTEKIDDISVLFIHMHHLINEFRPHQARETLRVTLELQKRQRGETALRYRKHLEKAKEILQQATESLPNLELEPSVLSKTELLSDEDKDKEEESDMYSDCTPEDRLMCQIIDNMIFNRMGSNCQSTKSNLVESKQNNSNG